MSDATSSQSIADESSHAITWTLSPVVRKVVRHVICVVFPNETNTLFSQLVSDTHPSPPKKFENDAMHSVPPTYGVVV